MGEAHIAAAELEPEGWVIVESRMFFAPILVRRVEGGHLGLVLECTHKACTLDAPRPDRISCPCHGSRFDEHGQVEKGPAREPLGRVDVIVEGTRLRLVQPRVEEEPS